MLISVIAIVRVFTNKHYEGSPLWDSVEVQVYYGASFGSENETSTFTEQSPPPCFDVHVVYMWTFGATVTK